MDNRDSTFLLKMSRETAGKRYLDFVMQGYQKCVKYAVKVHRMFLIFIGRQAQNAFQNFRVTVLPCQRDTWKFHVAKPILREELFNWVGFMLKYDSEEQNGAKFVAIQHLVQKIKPFKIMYLSHNHPVYWNVFRQFHSLTWYQFHFY